MRGMGGKTSQPWQSMHGRGTKSTGRQRLSRLVKGTESGRLKSRGYCREERRREQAGKALMNRDGEVELSTCCDS